MSSRVKSLREGNDEDNFEDIRVLRINICWNQSSTTSCDHLISFFYIEFIVFSLQSLLNWIKNKSEGKLSICLWNSIFLFSFSEQEDFKGCQSCYLGGCHRKWFRVEAPYNKKVQWINDGNDDDPNTQWKM